MDDENGIAIIGIGCRFPGADDIDEFWKLLENGECHIDIVPEDRWNVQEADIRDPDESWKDCARHAGLINEYDRWDNKFFGVSDTEAACMNPQQCLALEVTHSALENGGLTKGNMKKSKTGVYIGIMNNDLLLGLPNARNEFNNFLVTGIASSITSNRISFHYDLLGPSLTVDTACSSALVSVHLGCQAIRTGECEMAICGGVNSILTPVNFVPLSKAKMISPTGKSHAFSNQADGYVRGEGCGIVILKKYKKAKFDGNHIWGLIATGCNQDGQSNTPITAPSSDQQQALLKEVYSKYQVDPKTVQYIEAHGTGTPVGDPIEIKALSSFFSSCLKNDETIPIGSVKTNIGHLESSAGTAGLIKTLLMMRSGKLVPSLHFKENEGNADINFNEIPLRVVTNISDWNTDSRGQRIACVNSFGFGGTNCHAVVKQMQVETRTKSGNNAFEHYVVCLTGTSMPALQKSVRHMKEKIEQKNYSIKDIAFTSLLKRDHFRYRITYVVSSCQDLVADITRKERAFDQMTAVDTKESKLIFLFCGVGTVWKGTCQQMFNSITPFREKFQQIDKEFRKFTKFSIIDEIQNPSDDIVSDPYKGPLIIFASQISLFHLWAHLGVHPDVIIGQSVGEVAASHAAGCLSFEDAVKIIHHRSLLSSKASGGGMMVIGKCDVNEIEKLCGQFENKICIAVYSSKEACVVSGDRDVIDQMKEKLEKEMPNLLLKKLDVNCAYHSHHMDEISKEIEEKLTGIEGKAPNIHLISTVTGISVTDDMMSKPLYWTNNLRKPVLLEEAVSFCMNEEKSNVVLEIGPKPVIRAHLSKISPIDAASVASLNQPNEKYTFVNAMADLFQRGLYIQWGNFFNGTEQLIDIPRYKFNRSGILIKSDALREGLRATVKTKDNHPFIFPKPLSRNFRVELSPEVTPYVYEHVVDGRSIAPGAIHGEIGIVVATEIMKLPISQVEISLQFIRPLSVGRDQIMYLETAFNEKENSFEIKRRKEIVCKGSLKRANDHDIPRIRIEELRQKCQIYTSCETFYDTLEKLGFQYGKCLKIVGDCWRSKSEFIAEIHFCPEESETVLNISLHPAVLDAALQTIALCYLGKEKLTDDSSAERPIPVRIKSLVVHRPMEEHLLALGKLVRTDDRGSLVNVLVVNERGNIVVEIEGYEVQNIAIGVIPNSLTDKLYEIEWKQMEIETENINFDDHKTLSITFTHDTEVLLRHIFADSNSNIAYLPFNVDSLKMETMLEELWKYINIELKDLSTVTEILFFPGLSCLEADQNAIEIFNMVKSTCLVLTGLIQHLIKANIDVPLYIMTKKTQSRAFPTEIESHTVNVIGSELWGMGRCLVRERSFSQIRLIDVDDDNDAYLIKYIMFGSDVEHWRKAPEFKLQDKKLYINQIHRSVIEEQPFKHNTYNQLEEVELRSSCYERIEKPFFMQKSDLPVPLHFVKMKISNAYVNDVWVPSIKTKAMDDPDPWNYRSKNGHQVFTSEVTGTIVNSSRYDTKPLLCFSSSKVLPSDVSQKVEYVTCFPSTCSNFAVVPESCLIAKSRFPVYRPGMLVEILMYFALVEQSKENTPVTVLYDEVLKLDLSIFRCVVERLKRKVLLLAEIASFSGFPFQTKTQVIILSRNSYIVENILNKLDGGQISVLSFTNFLQKPLERRIRHTFPNISLKLIDNDNILCQDSLTVLIKKVVEWLTTKKAKTFLEKQGTFLPEMATLISFDKAVKENENTVLAKQLAVATTKENMFSKTAIYVVVGGLTGLGWKIVNKIAEMGGGILFILARRSPTEEQQTEVDLLISKCNCKIESVQADVAIFSSVQTAFQLINNKFPEHEIKGIFHGAAVVDDAIILHMTEEKIDKVLRPKILGTWNLHLISRELNLDYFVLHSSITSAFGNSGQTNYGAGNSFKDAVAFYRRATGMSGQTINWGPLRLGLLKTFAHVEKHLNSQGYMSLTESEVMDCFIHSLHTDSVQIICGSFDWKTVVRQSPDMLHLTSRLQPILVELNLLDIFTTTKNIITSIDTQELLKLSTADQMQKIIEVVSLIAADICAVEISVVQPGTKLVALGIDSMKGMAFINAVYEHVSCRIPILAIIEEESSVESVTKLILEQLHSGGENTGFIPIEKMYELQKELEKTKVPLNSIEKMYFIVENGDGFSSFNFIEAVFEIENSELNSDVLVNCFQQLKQVYPDLTSVYFVEDDVPYRAINEQGLLNLEENVKKDYDEVNLTSLRHTEENDSLTYTNIDFNIIGESKDPYANPLEKEKHEYYGTQLLMINVLSKENEIRQLHFRFHRLYFDFTSMSSLLRELYAILDKVISKEVSIPGLISTMSNEMIESKLKKTEEKMRFWEEKLSHTFKPIHFSSRGIFESTKIHMIVKRMKITEEKYECIQKWTKEKRVSVRDLILSAYQLLLHFISNHSWISVLTNFDLREGHVEKSGSLESILPIITKIEENDISATDFVQARSKEITSIFCDALLSYDALQSLIADKISIPSMFMHAVFYDNCNLGAISEKTLGITPLYVVSIDSRFGSSVHIIPNYEEHSIELELHCQPNFADNSIITNILTGLVELTNSITTNRNVSIQQLKNGFKKMSGQTKIIEQKTTETEQTMDRFPKSNEHIYCTFEVSKETSQGWEHDVILELLKSNDTKRLSWRANSGKKHIDVASLSKMIYTSRNGTKTLLLETLHRNYVFKSSDSSKMNTLWRNLESFVKE